MLQDIMFDNGVIHVIDSFLMLPANVSTTAVNANLTSLVGALNSTDLVSAVDSTPDVTIFAPSNAAFKAIGSAAGNLSMEALSSILTYHVVEGTVGYSSSLEAMNLTTLNGADLSITVDQGIVFVNSAKVIIPDVLVANGVVHVIDGVLNPDNAGAEPDKTGDSNAFPGATSAADEPFTSGVPTPTGSVPTAGAGSEGDSGSSSASVSSTGMAAMPMRTGAIGAAALFGGAAALYNM
jgi:uncharacterized surface protein with fasciclin (FAS1) repeats